MKMRIELENKELYKLAYLRNGAEVNVLCHDMFIQIRNIIKHSDDFEKLPIAVKSVLCDVMHDLDTVTYLLTEEYDDD